MERFWNVSRSVAAAVVLGASAGAQAQYQVAKLMADDGEPGDGFGPMAAEGDVLAVGAPGVRDDTGQRTGAVYVFERSGRGWGQAAKLLAGEGGEFSDGFGGCVALSGNSLLIGALDDELGRWAGAAYIFELREGAWVQAAKLLASDGSEEEYFGSAVAIEGETAVISAVWDGYPDQRGAAYIFERIDGVWTETAKLTGSDCPLESNFGRSVAISGGTVLVGAEWADGQQQYSGASYVFEKVGGVWTEIAKLTASDGQGGDQFGAAASLDGDAAIIGAPWTSGPQGNQGAAYVFHRSDGAWSEVGKVTDSSLPDSAYYGSSVSIEGDTAAVGAHGDRVQNQQTGSVHLYRRDGDAWSFLMKLTGDQLSERELGSHVWVQGDEVFAAANGPDFRGAVYVLTSCPADFNADFQVDTRDIVAFLNAWVSGDTRADWDQNGTIDTQDVLAFLNDWAGGC